MKKMGAGHFSLEERHFMSRCLQLAARGRPAPNPFVGAVIVDDKSKKIIGEGFHHRAGQKHAEVEAMEAACRRLGRKRAFSVFPSCTLYVNLEPCNHFGRMPPCTRAIVKAGIKRVVFAMPDPNLNVRGGGEKELKRKRILVRSGILESEARELNRAFVKHAASGLPFVTLKMAQTADGRFITRRGEPRWISGSPARLMVHQLRNQVGALVVGIGTVLADNPQLTTRLPGKKKKNGHDPLRVIIDPELQIPLGAKVLKDRNALVVCGKEARAGDAKKRKETLERKKKIEVWVVPAIKNGPAAQHGQIDLSAVLKHLAKCGTNHVLCEGGPGLAASFIEQKQVDELMLFVAPKKRDKKKKREKKYPPTSSELHLSRAISETMQTVSVRNVGKDRLIVARPRRPG